MLVPIFDKDEVVAGLTRDRTPADRSTLDLAKSQIDAQELAALGVIKRPLRDGVRDAGEPADAAEVVGRDVCDRISEREHARDRLRDGASVLVDMLAQKDRVVVGDKPDHH